MNGLAPNPVWLPKVMLTLITCEKIQPMYQLDHPLLPAVPKHPWEWPDHPWIMFMLTTPGLLRVNVEN